MPVTGDETTVHSRIKGKLQVAVCAREAFAGGRAPSRSKVYSLAGLALCTGQ
jgi:hypothetical protein